MKSTKKQLESRGYISEEELRNYDSIQENEFIYLLKSSSPRDRTIGVKIAGSKQNINLLPILCTMLENEKALYTKIALSETIELYGIISLKYLIPLLGKIGNNRHKKAALADLNKKSYPLPRDAAARIIIRIGEPALPFLDKVLLSGTESQISEAIDAIGHITFYSNNYYCKKSLLALYRNNSNNELITWKCIKAFQSFQSREIEDQLISITVNSDNIIFIAEAERSLKQIRRKRSEE